jgi:hypothetical protein
VTARLSRPRAWEIEAAGVALYLAIVAAQLAAGLRHTGGVFVYAQDDPYIHLSLARTLAEHGVWGIRPQEFASASSSPLWTLMLAFFWKAGVRSEWLPFLMNVVCGAGAIVLAGRMLTPAFEGRWKLAVLAAFVTCVPLTTLAFIGMEHSFQILLALAFVWQAARMASGDDHVSTPAVALLAMALTAVRYEGLFVVAAASLTLWRTRHAREALTLLLAAAIPVALAGGFFVWHGGTVLPNSLLMKSTPARFATFGAGVAAVLSDWASVIVIYRRPPELALLLASLGGIALLGKPLRVAWTRAVAETFVVVVLLHCALVKLEFFYRYEAYLVALGCVGVAMLGAEIADRLRNTVATRLPVIGILGVLAMPLVIRALSAATETPTAMGNVFEQQYQMGLFFRDNYAGTPIAINDIGAVGWMSSSPILDVYGLATQEVADKKRHGAWTAEALEALASDRGVRAVAVYERVLAPLIPSTWILVGEWRIPDNVAVSEDTVGFYAPTAVDVPRLRSALDGFVSRLPSPVTYSPGPAVRTAARAGGSAP